MWVLLNVYKLFLLLCVCYYVDELNNKFYFTTKQKVQGAVRRFGRPQGLLTLTLVRMNLNAYHQNRRRIVCILADSESLFVQQWLSSLSSRFVIVSAR